MQGGTVASATDVNTFTVPAEAVTRSVPRVQTRASQGATPRLVEVPSTLATPSSASEPGTTRGMLVKAVADRVLALVGIIVLLPLFLGLSLAIRCTSRGPALFRQRRVGRNGEMFTMLKFRTMRVGAEAELGALLAHNESDGGVLFKIRNDPRITSVGRGLRRLSLDELPQLFNVLTGSMSLVGPRPPLPDEVARYGPQARRRLAVRPGLTGLWQVSGRSDLSWEESLRLDLRYVDDWSLSLDTRVLFKTLAAVVRADGAY